MSDRLPRPVTSTDQYLAAVLTELKTLNANLAATKPAPAAGDIVPIKEPAPTKKPAQKRTTRKKAPAKKKDS